MEKDQCKLYHSDRYLNNNSKYFKTKEIQTGTIVSKATETFPKHSLVFFRLVLWANYRHYYISAGSTKSHLHLNNKYNTPETLSTKVLLLKSNDNWVLFHILLTSIYLHCMSFIILKKLAAISFGKCQCLKIDDCAKGSKVQQNRYFEDFKPFNVTKKSVKYHSLV